MFDAGHPAPPTARSCSHALAAAVAGILSAFVAAALPAHAQDGTASRLVAQAEQRPNLAVAPTISAGPASQAPLQIRITPADAAPKNSFVRVRGLPPAISLSDGHATGPGAWAVPLYAVATLQMIIPAGITARVEVSIALVNEDGAVLAEARSVLVVQAAADARPEPPRETRAPPQPPNLPTFSQPAPPVLSPSDREAAERLAARGEREIEQGNVAGARQFFLRAAQANLARGALLLAATYDPRELARWGVQGVQPNLAEARKWYERARELGAPEAAARLAGLGGG